MTYHVPFTLFWFFSPYRYMNIYNCGSATCNTGNRVRGRPLTVLPFIWHGNLKWQREFTKAKRVLSAETDLLASPSCNQLPSPQTEVVRSRNHIFRHLGSRGDCEGTFSTWRKVSSLSWKLLWSANHKKCVTREWCLLCLRRFMAKPRSFALVMPAIEWLNSLLSFIINVQMKRTYFLPSL